MNPRLLHPFHEQKSVKAMSPNEEGLSPNKSWSYKIFPKMQPSLRLPPRQIPDYNVDAFNI